MLRCVFVLEADSPIVQAVSPEEECCLHCEDYIFTHVDEYEGDHLVWNFLCFCLGVLSLF